MNVVFVAPYFRAATLRFVESAMAIEPAVNVGLISQDPIEGIRPDIRERIAGHYQVRDGMDARQLADAVRAMQRHFGRVDRLLGTLEHIQVHLGLVRDALGIEGMSAQTATNFRDKSRMKDVLRSAGLPCAHHTRVHSVEEARAFVERVGLPIVLKPLDGAASIATFRVHDQASFEAALKTLNVSASNPAQAEEFITGLERSFETASSGGHPLWIGYTRYTPPPLHVLENPWIQWTVTLPREENTAELDAIREPGLKAIRALGVGTAFTHMEWFRRPDGSVAISEVAARPPGAQIMTLNSYAYDTNFFHRWAELMVHGTWKLPTPAPKYAAGCAFFRGQGNGQRVAAVHGLDQAQAEVGELVVETRLPQVGWPAAIGSYEGDGYAIVRHPSTERVEQALQVLISRIRIDLG